MSNSNKGDSNEGGKQATAMRAMVTATATAMALTWAMARAAWAIGTVMSVVGNKEGKGGKAMAMATRMLGKWTATATKR